MPLKQRPALRLQQELVPQRPGLVREPLQLVLALLREPPEQKLRWSPSAGSADPH
jgi:hypothetical protein